MERRIDQYIDWAVRLLLLAGIGFGWDVSNRLTRMETQLDESLPAAARVQEFISQGPRFTHEDARSMEADIKGWVEARLYPEWLRNDMTEIKAAVKILPAIEARLVALESRVKALETK